MVRSTLLLLVLVGCRADPQSNAPEWRRRPGWTERLARVVRNHLPSAEPATPGPPPRHPPGSLWVEPGVAGPGTPLRCLLDGEPAVDATWEVDGASGPLSADLAAPATPGALVRCAIGEVRSDAVAVHNGDLPTNVLFILLDDIGVQDVSAYGEKGSARTPRIDQLAADGVRFERAWSQPLCSPTRASLMSGLHPMNHGLGVFTSEDGDGAGLDDRGLSVADVARARGAAEAGVFGKWHIGSGALPDDHPARFGFTAWAITPGNVQDEGEDYRHYEIIRNGHRALEDGYLPIATVDTAARFIRRQHAGWFAWVALNLAHAPYHQPPGELASPVTRDGVGGRYQAMVQAADTLIGRLLDSIPPDDLARTVVIVMGDNGTPEPIARPPLTNRMAKASISEGGIRVPLVVWGPSIASPGRVISTPVSAVDLLPTLAGLLGRPLPEREAAQVDGRSFADVLWSDHVPPDGRTIFAEIFGPNTHDPLLRKNHRRAISDGAYKLVLTPDGDTLYDLAADPWEQRPIVAEPSPVADALRVTLRQRYLQRPWPRTDWD